MDAVGYALASQIEPYRWKTVTNLPFNATFVRAELIGNKVYVLSKDRVQVYDILTGQWTQEPPMPADRQRTRFASCVVGTDIYVIGGVYDTSGTNISALSLVDIYDTASKAWKVGPDSSYRRLDAGCEYFNGFVYLIGGRSGLYFSGTGDDTSKICNRLNVSTGVWEKVADLPRSLCEMAICLRNGFIYTLGGLFDSTDEGTGEIDNIYEYNPTNNAWASKYTLSGKRVGGAAVTDGDKIFTLGGSSIVLEWYTPPSSKGILQSPTVVRHGVDAVYHAGVIYVFGGGNTRVDAYHTVDQPERGTLLAWLATR